MARLTRVIENNVKDILPALRKVHEPPYFHYIGFRTLYFKLDLELQTWNYFKKPGWIWSTTKKFMKNRGKISHESGKKITLIWQKMPKLKLFRFFMFLFFVCGSNPEFSCFLWFQTMLEFYTYRHITESSLNAKLYLCSQIYSVIS